MIFPLALAQFIASYAASSMNVAISSIAKDLSTTVSGVQLAITLFTLIMAAFMIPGSKLTDIWGRKKCFVIGLIIYAAGAAIATISHSLPTMIVGYSVLEGLGSALMIPPIYILLTVASTDLKTRAKYFGIVSAAAGVGAAAGPLIGGFLTSIVSWRLAFAVQVIVVIAIIFLSAKIIDAGIKGLKPKLDIRGTILSAAGLVFIVVGILQSKTYGWIFAAQDFKIGNTVIINQGSISPIWIFIAIGFALLALFYIHAKRFEKEGRVPLISTRLFKNKTSNLGLITQNIQWLIMQGGFFVISVYLQTVKGHNAIQTGLILTASTVGVLISSAAAGRLAQRRAQATLIRWGFITTISGMILLLLFTSRTSNVIVAFMPGLFLIGTGVGVMLTASVNVVQSAFPEKDQGEISGVSRSVSNLGSSLGTAIVGSVLVTVTASVEKTYGYALITVIIIGIIGFIAAMMIPIIAPPKSQSSR